MEDFLDANAKPELNRDPTGKRVTGFSGAGVGAVEKNPLTEDEEPASEQEQAAYDEGFKRLMGMIHDTRSIGGKKPMADNIIRALSNSDMPSYAVIGSQAGNLMRLFHENAKRQKVEYPDSVLMELGGVVIQELTDVARETGAIQELPEEDSPEMQDFYQMAMLEGAKHFGEYMKRTGQADQVGAQEVMTEQMEREASSGGLDDWDMQEMDPDALKNAMAQQGGFA